MDVIVNPNELVPGLLPAVCVKTGEPAETTRKAAFRHTPLIVWLLLPFGLLIAAIVAEVVSTRVKVAFPVSKRVVREHRRRIWVAVAVAVVIPVAFLYLAAGLHQGAIAWLALASFLIGLVLAFRAQTWLPGKLSKEGWLTLKGVSPVWAEQRQALVAYHSAVAYQQQVAYAQYQQGLAAAQSPANAPYQQL